MAHRIAIIVLMRFSGMILFVMRLHGVMCGILAACGLAFSGNCKENCKN
jgi:hypothetical protein